MGRNESVKFRGLRTPTPTHGRSISVPTQPQGSGSLVPGDQRKSNFLNQTSQETECPGGTGAEQASGAFPSSILDVPAKSPQPPALLGGRGGRRGGAPRLPSPSPSWPPPALPAGSRLPLFPRWDSSSSAPPPPHLPSPAPWQFPNPAPTPLWESGRGKGPHDPVCSVWTLTNTPTPIRPGMLGRGCGISQTTLDEFYTPPQTRPDTHTPCTKSPGEGLSPHPACPSHPVLLSDYPRTLSRPLAPGRGQPRTKA